MAFLVFLASHFVDDPMRTCCGFHAEQPHLKAT
jgi:hypothetical protein